MIKRFVFAVLSALFIVCLIAVPVYAKAIPLRVPANVEWVNTEIDAVAGDTYNIKTHGKAITGPLNEYPGAISGPEGQITLCGIDGGYVEGETCVLYGEPFGALIGRIGEFGEPFLIGDAESFEALGDGDLYLAVNDFTGTYDDNLAGFTVIFK